jgi:glycosyltransferase involved in cell wall biosynthesis
MAKDSHQRLAGSGARKRVLIIQSDIKQYRLSFHGKLYEALRDDGIELRVAYSDPVGRESSKGDSVELPSEYGVKVQGHYFCGDRLLYQPLWGEVLAADMVIVPHANKHLFNFPLYIMSALRLKKVGFWGHGRNRQSGRSGLPEWLRKRTLNRANWWFAYTAETVDYLVQHGVRPERVTNVENAIDTTTFEEQLASITNAELAQAREQLGISRDAKVGLFCGGVTRDKKPEFLVEAALSIKQRLPQFELLAVGAGPEQAHFIGCARTHLWFHYLGPRFGREKALYFRLGDVFLMPGLVGLAILDAFAAGLPVFTTDIPIHSPEIEYLEENRNGVVTPHDVRTYCDTVVQLLADCSVLHKLKVGALASAREHSIDKMVANFHRGIMDCLQLETAHPVPRTGVTGPSRQEQLSEWSNGPAASSR